MPGDLPAPAWASTRAFAAGLTACTAAVAVFLLARLTAWPPHEDETLALFVGRESLADVLMVVQGERGGAPLHFVLAWAVTELGGGLTALRAVSALFAIAAVPLIGLLARRLAGIGPALVASLLASASWMLLFHGVYARMYSLFLFTSLLSYLGLLAAARDGGRRRWAVWALAALAAVAAHPYGLLVVASQALFVVLARARVREAIVAFATVAVVGTPFWYADLVLARRFDVGVGGGGEKLTGPLDVLAYLAHTVGDFTAGWRLTIAGVVVLAAAGAVRLARAEGRTALFVGAVFAVPTAAFLVARFGSAAAPETRHLIFTLPFFALIVAVGSAALRRIAPAVVVALVIAQLAWAYERTPQLFEGEPKARETARAAASEWLAETGRPDDVLFGYDPLFLGAWERNGETSRTVVPRADPKLALDALQEAPTPLGRGVWVLDASDTNNFDPRPTIERRIPAPERAFEARVFGPFLVIRTREAARTPARFLDRAASVMKTGKSLFIGDADVNYLTVTRARERLVDGTVRDRAQRSPSATSR